MLSCMLCKLHFSKKSFFKTSIFAQIVKQLLNRLVRQIQGLNWLSHVESILLNLLKATEYISYGSQDTKEFLEMNVPMSLPELDRIKNFAVQNLLFQYLHVGQSNRLTLGLPPNMNNIGKN